MKMLNYRGVDIAIFREIASWRIADDFGVSHHFKFIGISRSTPTEVSSLLPGGDLVIDNAMTLSDTKIHSLRVFEQTGGCVVHAEISAAEEADTPFLVDAAR